jgi:hypothetical protein
MKAEDLTTYLEAVSARRTAEKELTQATKHLESWETETAVLAYEFAGQRYVRAVDAVESAVKDLGQGVDQAVLLRSLT